MEMPTRLPDAPVNPDRWTWIFLSLHGRVSRRSFWIYGVGALLAAAIYLHAIGGIVGLSGGGTELLVNLLLLLPAVAVSAKRWQDRDRSPWWVLVALLPVIGWLWALVDNGFVRGSAGPNRFGPAPER